MKKVLLLLPLLLVACATSTSSSSSESNQSTSSSNETSQSTSLNNNISEIERFCDNLASLEGKVQTTHAEIESIYYYLTDAQPLEILISDVSDMTRYNSSEGQIMVKKGTTRYLNDDLTVASEDEYEMQIFYDKAAFYRITDYKDESVTDKKETIPFSEKTIDINLNIGFPLTEINNFKFMEENIDNSNLKVEYKGINDFVTEGTWEYSYGITLYDSGIPAQKIYYKNKLFIENSLITKVEQEYHNELYAGGKKANWNESYSTTTFTQGERLDFEGTRFNPKSYN